ncbi:MAG: hypothetical protein CLLPBCKN_004791 [Chroococcidiopsis cubana SAG 39.79]|jgi:amino-acid N-acetyltransferase|uniref:GCN5-related N-acetyltransferase n=2 Tax=Chroococcidiopsis TaxID=54298 RepID=K9TZP7_CHRTP|nr:MULTISPECIES: GNAT family N-acetyltransferase [Chroococcidiopsis]PSB42912.1 GNAT family N-acetyltransferase [Cyanosarcina cf. burmensis CCALA 770]AFY87848.1 GCN5-related N-acetyltransferase [Chroococcidiopsis thermalis PCC 7203]MDZ4875395.1 hypothetical protein [Chroococcidiopsis cubana SAG 39.79]PSB64646.1 GNAT family N-acetyltransferase [Chroococcidiopsis cubana CCALA 043]PSM48397.1 GNAT family N-acetyltransferase [Chroococcidiopsis sp. CCALA 051]
MSTLPSGCNLRPANAKDAWAIRKLVLSAKLDPTQLRWQQFSVVECNGRVVACGQLRAFAGAQELGSLVVASNWRGKGLGSYLVEYLIEQATQPLYLECLGRKLAEFYTRFGFVAVTWKELPRSLKFKFALSDLAAKIGVPVTIMRYSKL